MNNENKQPIVAYSFDAGFHAFVFTLKENKEKVLDIINNLNKNGDVLERII